MLGLREELNKDLKLRVVEHRNRFIELFYNRYKELLPSIIIYQNDEATSIDFLKLEVALRHNYNIAIGKNKSENIVVLGYVRNLKSSENPIQLFDDKPLTKKDIEFVIPEEEIPEEMTEISYMDDCMTGNFVVLKNKTLNYVNDYDVLLHYTMELAELVLSRYSISMQSKINTFFIGEHNDETFNQIISDLYNGSPYIKVSKLFDPIEQIYTLENEHLANIFQELKREYQNKISELNNMIGINSLAVEKSSGVSDTEAKSNRAYTSSNANIYLSARQQPLDKLNKRYGLNVTAVYNDEVASELGQVFYDKEVNS